MTSVIDDPYLQFKVEDDYLFKMEHFTTALEKLDLELQEENRKKQEAKETQQKNKQFTLKEKYTTAFQFENSDESTNKEVGFLYELGATLKSTIDDITKNYLSVVNKLLA